ncbi:Transposable element P transposase [Paramuricea clavata]|uniref:Transposable element P transposase n=1 Tax=Paramuricea clavata TaxID=317549 RepID=A0A7D9L8W0_PARCT|nr:Transposable element P transposase [Paramuricea clavata]
MKKVSLVTDPTWDDKFLLRVKLPCQAVVWTSYEQLLRLQCKQLDDRVKELETRMKKDGVSICETLEKDILKIMGGQNLEATPHMKFFWQQQMELLQTEKMAGRYHPQIILFALSLHGKSPAAYRELRDSGALILPSERVLRDYKNYSKPKAGLNRDNIESLQEKASSAAGIQRYVVPVMDEMKIQSNLVFDKYPGDLIGFVDLGDPMTNYACLGDEDVMATHALAFLVKGMCTDMKHVIAYYFTENVTSYQLMSMFCKIVGVFEVSLNFWIITAVNVSDLESDVVFKLNESQAGNPSFKSICVGGEWKEEVLGTAQFCRMMNDFFDCTNVRSLTEHVWRINYFIKPYTAQDNERFVWMKTVFLQYLENWRQSTMTRDGVCSTDDRGKMFLSIQTYKGLKISIHAHIEAIRFLLAEGFQYVLSERFMLDVLEDYFGHQRQKVDVPTIQQLNSLVITTLP